MSKTKTDIELTPVKWDAHGRPVGYAVTHSDRGDIIEQEPLPPALRSDARTKSAVTGNHKDRAWAFSIRTAQLAAITGVAVWLVGKMLIDYPLLSVVALLWLTTGFAAVWLGAFILDAVLSAEGIELIDTLLFWRFAHREQEERFARRRLDQ